MPDAEFSTLVVYLLLDIGAEFLVGVATCVLLYRLGFAPLRMLRALFAKSLPLFIVLSSGNMTYYLALQHSHCGADMSFTFPWFQNRDARWKCGLSWAEG